MADIHDDLLTYGLRDAERSCPDKAQRIRLRAAHEVMSDEDQIISIAHAGFAMTSLPHRRIKETVWTRESGPIKLRIEAGLDEQERQSGVPYGPIARLILLYLQTQAVKTGSRQVELGASMNAWLKNMGISVGGKTYAIVREQANRISQCRLTFFHTSSEGSIRSNGSFIRSAWLPSNNESRLPFWQEVVTLDEDFYNSLILHPLPLREVAIKQMVNASKAMDLYIWLAYRLHVLAKPVTISWAGMRSQFGNTTSAPSLFRKDIMPALKLALSVYPEARVEIEDNAGLTIYPSPPPVTKQNGQIYKSI
ncbi:pirin [Acetobacter tropicalis]|uniref:Pirin n=1 Tax=Acetobacter tropicalis TaxID=104102 RepID=A0A149U4G4_9PROT|nr:replication protein RepA [Acetobacter tropicalis]KXV60298.1 pirin [Acetobacter tropicalis]